MAITIKCTTCRTEIEVSEAIARQVSEDLIAAERSKFNKIELELRQKNSLMEERLQNFDLTLQRKLDEEKQKIINKTTEQLLEQQHLKDKEKDKVIDDLKKSLEDAQRKASQGSQQLQGEVQELDLEATLKTNFPGDEIIPVAKGVNGADIKHIIKSPNTGITCGVILWESKRTKAWSDGWITKLKEDLRNEKANIPAIVSETLPEEFKMGIGVRDGVWICGPKYVTVLGLLLAKSLRDAAYQRLVSQNSLDKAAQVYAYFTSHHFVQQVESMVESVNTMREQINREKVALEKIWAARETQITKLSGGITGVYGSLQGIAGTALPELKILELE